MPLPAFDVDSRISNVPIGREKGAEVLVLYAIVGYVETTSLNFSELTFAARDLGPFLDAFPAIFGC